jgi:hypothetical protein
MRSLDFGGDAKRHGVTAANRTEPKKIKIAGGEVSSGKAAKIGFSVALVSRSLQPTIVDAIEVNHCGLQAFGLKHGGKAQYADRGKLAHDSGRFRFAHNTAIELIGRGSTDETNLHDCHLFGLRMNDSGSISIKVTHYRV